MIALALALALACAAAPPDPGAAADAARFADWLAGRGDYYRAIGEYERALFLDPEGAARDALALRIARAYAAGGKPDAAVGTLRALVEHGRDAAARDEALWEIGLVRWRAGAPEAAAAALAPYADLATPAGGPGPERARLLLSLALLGAGDAARARLALEPIGEASPLAADARSLRAATFEVERAPRKSAALAGVLSAAVPGLGHAYAGDPGGAAGALALNGLFVWATVDAFRDRRYGLGALLALGESIWYGGAIFGAVAEAMRFNRDARDAALDAVNERFRLVVEPLPGGVALGVGGALGGAPRAR